MLHICYKKRLQGNIILCTFATSMQTLTKNITGSLVHKVPSPLSIILLIALFSCNHADRAAEKHIHTAENVMETIPDSAIREIERIDTTNLSEAMKARYCLAISKARHQNYDKLGNLPLLYKTVLYLKGQNGYEEIQSLYYYAWSLREQKQDDKAFLYYHLVYDKAKEHSNLYYWGLSARALSEMYGNRFQYDKQLALALESIETLRRYESNINTDNRKLAAWSDVMLSQAYINLDQPDSALEVCRNVDKTLYDKDSFFRYRILQNTARSFHLLRRFKEAADIYHLMQSQNMEMDGDDWCSLCHNLFNAGAEDEACIVFNRAAEFLSTPQDSLYHKMIESFILEYKGKHKEAYSSAREYEKMLGNRSDLLLEKQDFPTLAGIYKEQADTNRKESFFEKKKNQILIIVCCLIIAISGICLYNVLRYRKRLHLKNLDHKKLLFETNELEKRLKDLDLQCSSLIDILNKKEKVIENLKTTHQESKSSTIFIDRKKLLETIKRELKNVNDISYALYYCQGHLISSKEIFTDALIMQLEQVRSEKALESYDTMIDIYSKGWINKIITLYPEFRKTRIRFIRYLYAGFSSEAIAFLTKRSSKELVHTAKSKLKSSLMENCDNNNIKEIFKNLHIKD